MIAGTVQRVRDEMANAAISAGRKPEEITLMAVTKTHPPEAVRDAARAGVLHFGENRVQEAGAKIPLVDAAAVWHLIGPLQSNKAGLAAGLFDWVDSVHSRKIAEVLSANATRLGKTIRVLVQVNISGEAAKSGVKPDEAEELIRLAAGLPGLEVRGIMTIGSFGAGPETARREFRRMRVLFDRLRGIFEEDIPLDVLSMGMSGDFAAAIGEGATMVRVGSAIFGGRI